MAASDPPPPTFAVEVDGTHAVLRVDQDLDLPSIQAANRAMDELFSQSARTVCVDLTAVRFVDSTGVKLLLQVLRETRERGGTTYVATTAEPVLRVLALLGVDQELEVVADPAEARRLAGER